MNQKYDNIYLNTLMEDLTILDLENIVQLISSKLIKEAHQLDRKYQEILSQKLSSIESKSKHKQEQVERPQWTKDEEQALFKLIKKFPPGTKDRLTRLSEGLKSKFDEQEVALKMADMRNLKEDTQQQLNANVTKTIEWSTEQQKQLQDAIKVVSKTLPPKERWEEISNLVEGKSAKDCVERFKEIQSKLKSTGK